MSNFYEETKSKELVNKLNMISNNNYNNDDYIFTNEQNNDKKEEKEQNNVNEFKNNFNNQQSIDFIENVQKENIDKKNNIISNISNKKNANNNFTEEEEENNNIINNNNEEEIEENNEEINLEQESINKIQKDNENNEDEELPLITLNFISICQCCKTSFDNSTYLPYLLKCGHFFCIKCINEYFTDKNGIKCPSDGLIAKSINELTLLNNLIPKTNPNISNTNNNLVSSELSNINIDSNINITNNQNNNNFNTSNFCSIHKSQKLSHVICDSNEIICVYCAFECLKKNPKCEIKELSSQLNDFTSNINEIINNNQNEVLNLHDSLKKIKTNKENEEKAINTFFDCVFDYLNEKKNEYLEQINNLFTNNAKKLGDKLEEVTENIDNSEKFKKHIEIFLENGGVEESNFKDNYNEILNQYLKLEQKCKINKQKMDLDEYKFVHIEEDKIVKNCHTLGEIKILNKKSNLSYNLSFHIKDNNSSKLTIEENNNLSLELKDKEKEKKLYYNDNNIFNNQRENIINIKEGKSSDNLIISNKTQIKNSLKNKNNNYIILDDLSITNNNNSYLNNDNNILKFDINNEGDNNNYYINDNNEDKSRIINNIFNKKTNFNNIILRKNTFNNKNDQKEKKVIIHKNAKSLYNYIEFPNYNTSLNNYYLLSKLNTNKRDKERNITVNNYEVHQTLKNSYNNNYNYGHNFNNSNFLNKLFEFNNSNFYGNNTNTNNINTNRRKFSFISGINLGSKNNNKFEFK